MFADKSYVCVDGKLHPYYILYTDETVCKYLWSWNMSDTEQLSYPLGNA